MRRPSTADVGAACKSSDDCRLGLVCSAGACAPSHDHPDLATQRSSPYRIGSDTCRAFTYLQSEGPITVRPSSTW